MFRVPVVSFGEYQIWCFQVVDKVSPRFCSMSSFRGRSSCKAMFASSFPLIRTSDFQIHFWICGRDSRKILGQLEIWQTPTNFDRPFGWGLLNVSTCVVLFTAFWEVDYIWLNEVETNHVGRFFFSHGNVDPVKGDELSWGLMKYCDINSDLMH